jgi:hypothetical protein
MIYNQISSPKNKSHPEIPSATSEMNKVLTAAVINTQFRSMLLKNPWRAIHKGFAGERFKLESEEQRKLASIRANNLARKKEIAKERPVILRSR